VTPEALQARSISTEPAAGTIVDLRCMDNPRPGASGGEENGPFGQPDTDVVQPWDSPSELPAQSFSLPPGLNPAGDLEAVRPIQFAAASVDYARQPASASKLAPTRVSPWSSAALSPP
jgi:hypothetical protein